MRSLWANRAHPPYQTRIHPALTSFADECCSTLARLLAYVGTLALVAILGIHLWDQLPADEANEPAAKAAWSVADRLHPAFAVSQFDLPEKTETYAIFRHPLGGRRDVIRWAARDAAPGDRPVAELEIYRPGGEFGQSGQAIDNLAAGMEPKGPRNLEAAGVVDSKFGSVTLLRAPGDIGSCLGFLKHLNDPSLQISGWSCQGEALPAQRAAVGCMLNRLMLLTAGNDPKLAELFARAELRRTNCASTSPSAASPDWVTSADDMPLRGTL
ncbi:MAG: hypothetical protein ACXU9A_25075 [Xanthobacteraceae bacterium]